MEVAIECLSHAGRTASATYLVCTAYSGLCALAGMAWLGRVCGWSCTSGYERRWPKSNDRRGHGTAGEDGTVAN